MKVPLGTFPPEPSAYTESATFSSPGGSAELCARYERDGSIFSGGIAFTRVRAYRFRAEGHCTSWHTDGSYDELVEVVPSEWVAELVAAEPAGSWGQWVVRHFLIFIDSVGAFEVAAESHSWLPERAAATRQ
ncbi:MAG TPA: hypothetical protein VGC37_03660 [Friedmanniella sp.]